LLAARGVGTAAPLCALVTDVIHIVDDDEAVRDSLKLFLELGGRSVGTFGSGADLFGFGRHELCRCLILDIDLPGDNGIEVLTILRGMGFFTPAIFMSGHADTALRVPTRLAHVVACFDKPVPPLALLAAIDTALERRE
jgi:two-component system, LuxR family, response regulator FixJ